MLRKTQRKFQRFEMITSLFKKCKSLHTIKVLCYFIRDSKKPMLPSIFKSSLTENQLLSRYVTGTKYIWSSFTVLKQFFKPWPNQQHWKPAPRQSTWTTRWHAQIYNTETTAKVFFVFVFCFSATCNTSHKF